MSTAENEATITLAGGRIRCRRCQAKSRRSQQQCKKPAIRGKRVCGFHGGKSTGPKTAAGRQRCADAKTVHGRETRAIRAQRSGDIAYLRNLEDAGRVLGVIGGTRTPGRKPATYLASGSTLDR
jgi:outer membrane receptor for monomeric catechols